VEFAGCVTHKGAAFTGGGCCGASLDGAAEPLDAVEQRVPLLDD
jgi:hypothetical protein